MKRINNKKIRLFFISSLIFSFLLMRCGQQDETKSGESTKKIVLIQWEGSKAMGVLIPRDLLADMPDDSASQWMHVYIATGNFQSPILGDYDITPEGIIFRPLVPFTAGLEYEVRLKGEPISQFEVPVKDADKGRPEPIIYPTSDTLPENLLKIYLEFNRPMQEGNTMDYIRIIKNGKDTLPAVFLDLRPELWNKEGTILTVWLDPGRIKRDLQPNTAMGPPLEKGNNYTIVILEGWPDKQGQTTAFAYMKDFFAGPRDSLSPDPAKWTIEIPKPDSDQPVEILFHESIDYMLLKNAIHITDEKGNDIHGKIEVNTEEKSLNFIPSSPWKAGNYILEVESRLEDNAGNNLNHPFDNDLTQKQTEQKEVVKRTFRIR